MAGNISRLKIIIDTDVFSYLWAKTQNAQLFNPYVSQVSTGISFATVGETLFGAYKANWGQKRIADLKMEIKRYTVLRSNYSICEVFATIKNQCLREGHPIGDNDYWIGACAIYHDCPLVTNNGRHFEYIKGLKLISPNLN